LNRLENLSCNLDLSEGECHALKAQRDKLVQQNFRIAKRKDSLEQKVQSLFKIIERLQVLSPSCLHWSSPMQNSMHSMQDMEKQQSIAMQNLEKQRTDGEVLRQSTAKHYQNTLKEEQGKLQLKEEELGAANSEISRIKSETAKQTDAVEVQKALVVDLQGRICGLEADLETAVGDERNEISRLKAQVTAWFWGCAESAVSHNWQLEETITLEKTRKEEVCAHDHSIFTLMTSAADTQADAVGNCCYRKSKQAH